MEKNYYMGIDVGSTTIKIILQIKMINVFIQSMSGIIQIYRLQLKH